MNKLQTTSQNHKFNLSNVDNTQIANLVHQLHKESVACDEEKPVEYSNVYETSDEIQYVKPQLRPLTQPEKVKLNTLIKTKRW